MAFSSATVTVGHSTKKSDYDRLLDNTKALKDESIILNGTKTFQSGTVFEVKPKVDGIQTRSATGSVSIECEYIDDSSVHSVVNLKTKVIEIGDWDMDADASKNVLHTLSNHTKIRNIFVSILRDDSTRTYNLEISSGGSMHGSIQFLDSTTLYLTRVVGGVFDSINFDSTSFNRGLITITYEM